MTPVMTEDWLLEAELAPAVEGDPLAPLYAGAADGLLVLPFCPACGLALELEQRVCDGCATAGADWRPVEPRGTVHAVTVVHRRERGLVRVPGRRRRDGRRPPAGAHLGRPAPPPTRDRRRRHDRLPPPGRGGGPGLPPNSPW